MLSVFGLVLSWVVAPTTVRMHRHLVRVTYAADDTDVLDGLKPLLRIEWDTEHALPSFRSLCPRLRL